MTLDNLTPLLSLQNIRKSYGPTEVLHGIDFDIHAGEVVALLGENGAGKSTLSNIISGTTTATSGHMLWQGKPYAPQTPREAMAKGVGMIHQELLLLPHLSIAENMFVGHYPTKKGCIDRKAMATQAHKGLMRLGLDMSPLRLVNGLSTANQQLVEIAKALTLQAKLLILDEPTAALGTEETQLLFKQIRRLKAEGVGIIYISHRLEEIKQIADRMIVMRDGAVVQKFDTAELPIRTIVETMVGRSLDQIFPPLAKPQDDILLEVKNVTSAHKTCRDIHFNVRKGEIFGIAGLVGAGRTELLRAISGADPMRSGEIFIKGQKIRIQSPKTAIDNGMVFIPEDRKWQGLITSQSIEDNMAYANFDQISTQNWLSQKSIRSFSHRDIAKFRVKGQSQQIAGELSGGNQQKVVLAKWLARRPHIVLLDEPTRGIDVGARSSIYNIIHDLAQMGIAVIVVSSDLEEVMGLSNRIMVMAKGRQAGILEASEVNDVAIMELATS